MSRNFSEAFIEEFDSAVHHSYQGMQLLAGRARQKRGVIGNKIHFPVMGKVRAQPKVHRAPVLPANVSWSRPEATLSDWHISDLTDVFEDIKTNVDERQNLGKSFSYAMGRQEDQFVIEAMESITSPHSTAAVTPFNPIVTIATNARPSKLIGACISQMRTRGVNRMERTTAVLPGIWEADFIADPSISSRDYGPDPNNATRTGNAPVTHGTELVFMDDRDETATDPSDLSGGFNAQGGEGWVFAESAIGVAYGKDPTLNVSYEDLYTSWLVTILLSIGSVAIDRDGVQKITGGPTS